MRRLALLIASVTVMSGIPAAQPMIVRIEQDSCAICKADVSSCPELGVSYNGSVRKTVGNRTVCLCDSCSQFWGEASSEIDKAVDSWISRHQKQNPKAVNMNRLDRRNAELLEIREKIRGLTDRERDLLGVKPKHWWKDTLGVLRTEDEKRP